MKKKYCKPELLVDELVIDSVAAGWYDLNADYVNGNCQPSFIAKDGCSKCYQ